MGLLEKLFGKQKTIHGVGYRTFTDLAPTITPWSGTLYQQELTRACVERFAMACVKLKPHCMGDPGSRVEKAVQTRPNPTMTWPTFLKRISAIWEGDGTAVVAPVFGADEETVVGFYPLRFMSADVIDRYDEPWIRFHFTTGAEAAFRLREVGIITKLQVESDFFGEANCLDRTLALIDAQNKAQDAAIKNGASVRFIGRVASMVRPSDLEEKRKAFVETNLTADNNGGIALYDQTISDVQQIKPMNYTISEAEMERIQDNVFTYFGTNKNILQNSYTEEQFDAFYEGRLEPFAVLLGESLTSMVYTTTQQSHGKRIEFSANRLAYSSNASKRNMVRDCVDRGLMTINEGREILQMQPVPDGDVRIIRGEYLNAAAVTSMLNVKGGGRMPNILNDEFGELDLEGDDQEYNLSDSYDQDEFED